MGAGHAQSIWKESEEIGISNKRAFDAANLDTDSPDCSACHLRTGELRLGSISDGIEQGRAGTASGINIGD